MPELFIITGSNGAGKSSLGPEYIPQHLRESIFDGDKLLMQKKAEFWKSGIKSTKECTKLASEIVGNTFEDLVRDSLIQNSDFAYEGHFTNHETWSVPQKFKDAGYKINLIFFGLTDTNLSELRVIGRSKEGGHYVDPITLSTNFYGNLEKLDIYFKIFDDVKIYDTSGIEHIELIKIKSGIIYSHTEILELPDWFVQGLPNINSLISAKKN
jgi:predicted ABC-type ATPase